MKNIFKKTKKFWKRSILIPSFIVFGLVFTAYGSIYIPIEDGTSTIDDHFFHYKYAKLLRTEGWDAVENFNWIYFTNRLESGERYHVSLYQIFLVPFTYIDNQELGLKISDIFLAGLTVGLFYFILRKMKIKKAFLLTLLLISFDFVVFRFLCGRAFLLTTILIYLEIFLAVRRKYLALFWIAFFHVLWHHATLFMPFLAVSIVEILRLATQNKIFIKNFLVSAAGIILAMAFYPNFPGNIFGWLGNIFNIQKGLISNEDIKSIEGKELHTVDIAGYLSDSTILPLLAILSFSIAVFYYIQFKKKQIKKIESEQEQANPGEEKHKDKINQQEDNNLLFYAGALFLLICIAGSMLVSGRFYDFYFPGAIIVFALAMKKIFSEEKVGFDKRLQKYLTAGIFLFLFIMASNSFIDNKAKIFKKESRPYFRAAEWVEENSDKGGIVFLSTWNLFPRSFFANHHNYYTMGIEPRAILEYNPGLFWKWFNFTKNYYYCEQQENCEDQKKLAYKSFMGDKGKIEQHRKEQSKKVIQSIKEDFKSDFIISSSSIFSTFIRENEDLIEKQREFEFDTNKGKVTVFKLK